MTGASPSQFARKAMYDAAHCPLMVEPSQKFLAPFGEMLRLRYWTFRRVWAVICLALFLALQLIADSGPLHKRLHPDAGSSDHHCTITLLLNGEVSAPEKFPILTAFIPVFLFVLPQLRPTLFVAPQYRFSESRAPPARAFFFFVIKRLLGNTRPSSDFIFQEQFRFDLGCFHAAQSL